MGPYRIIEVQTSTCLLPHGLCKPNATLHQEQYCQSLAYQLLLKVEGNELQHTLGNVRSSDAAPGAEDSAPRAGRLLNASGHWPQL